MKKVVLIVVFGFILVGCGTTIETKKDLGGSGNIHSKDENSIVLGITITGNAWTGLRQSMSDIELHRDIAAKHCATHKKFAFFGGRHLVDGELGQRFFCSQTKLDKSPDSSDPYYGYLAELRNSWSNYNTDSEFYKSVEKVKLTSMIDKAKGTCKSLGFKEDTEKFSDCALKLYTQSVELAAKQNQQIVSQGLVSGSNVVTIYDPVRDSAAAIKRGQGLINGTCTLGNLSGC